MKPDYSRALFLGSEATSDKELTLLERLKASVVTVGVGADRARLDETAEILVDTLQRLPLQLVIREDLLLPDLAQRLESIALAVDPTKPLRRASENYGFVVHIGGESAVADIRAAPVRHGVHLRTDGGPLTADDVPSGLGSMTCASFLAAEVFKHVANVGADRAVPQASLAWCPVTLSANPLEAPAAGEINLDAIALVGVGAIGTAIAKILSLMDVVGSLIVVDPERFGPENVGTYSIGYATDADERSWKTELIERYLPSLSADPHRVPVERLIADIDDGLIDWPRIVLSGLDSIASRHETQRIWSDRLIDGATGSTMCGVSDVRFEVDPCLFCIYPNSGDGSSALDKLSEVTGLSKNVLKYGDQALEPEHLATLTDEQRSLLASLVGQPICGLAEAIGLSRSDSEGYRPSISFVSQQAATLVIGRLVAAGSGIETNSNFVQYDALIGPQYATVDKRRRFADCYCQQREDLLRRVRESRRASSL